jgi:hypothetical protein
MTGLQSDHKSRVHRFLPGNCTAKPRLRTTLTISLQSRRVTRSQQSCAVNVCTYVHSIQCLHITNITKRGGTYGTLSCECTLWRPQTNEVATLRSGKGDSSSCMFTSALDRNEMHFNIQNTAPILHRTKATGQDRRMPLLVRPKDPKHSDRWVKQFPGKKKSDNCCWSTKWRAQCTLHTTDGLTVQNYATGLVIPRVRPCPPGR